MLAGSETRLPVALRLVHEGYGRVLVVSKPDRPTPLYRRVCGGPHLAVPTICLRASPYSTRGEARMIGGLARAHRWTRIDVVTSQFHVFRARILIQRCYHGTLRMVGAPVSLLHLPLDVVRESAKLAYQLAIARGC